MAPNGNRTVLLCLLLLAVSAGCVGLFGDGTDTDTDTTRFVPEGADAVLRLNATALHEEPTTETLFGALSETRDGRLYYESYDAFLEEAENRTDLDPRGLEEATAFVGVSDGSFTADGGYAAVVFRAGWDVDGMVGATPESVSVDESEYNDEPLYVFDASNETQSAYMTRLSENTYAVGTQDAVRDASDVSQKGEGALKGELREQLDRRRDEKVAFAASVSQEVVAAVPGSDLPPEALDGVSAVSGSYRTDAENGTVGVTVSLIPSEREEPENVRQTVDGFLSLAGMIAEDDETAEAIDSVDVTAEDSEVVVSYNTTPEDAVSTFRVADRRFRLGERLERSIPVDSEPYLPDETTGEVP